ARGNGGGPGPDRRLRFRLAEARRAPRARVRSVPAPTGRVPPGAAARSGRLQASPRRGGRFGVLGPYLRRSAWACQPRTRLDVRAPVRETPRPRLLGAWGRSAVRAPRDRALRFPAAPRRARRGEPPARARSAPLAAPAVSSRFLTHFATVAIRGRVDKLTRR